ncbi:L-idonate 5-dehydrogenase [Hoeflea sp. YIM 152468]|uniref:L-idonate 5-dehydrogenase n=1 Tax=Hoeflea sp. YIM 152468 TaxID=3031759 RepID=UPI0023DC64F4|nr:L-idonate 5-dehydrogenase [Hoeflea sp. YIM 152468]MDF1608881.1 L-idonate 5-dehydrogenase [Hoeflea sp. YIM 152468]
MKTRVCRLYDKHDIRVEIETVAEPGAGEVLVQMGAGGICGSDLHYYHDGGFGPIRVREPIILGHEIAGTVRAIGDGVDSLSIGDRVAVNPSHPCGHCKYCAQGHFQHCLEMRFLGSALRFPHEQGGFREFMLVAEPQCVAVGAGTTLGEAACSEPLAVCVHAANRAGDLAGKKVLVTGAGPIGALCAAVARHRGASEIVVTDLQEATLAVAEKMGATRTINVASAPAAMDAYAADKGYFDVVFECSAAQAALRTAIAAIRPMGKIVQVGVAGDVPIPLNFLVGKEIELIGTHRFHAEFAEAVDLITSTAIDVKPIITATFPLDDALQAFAAAGDRSRSVKVQLAF